MIDAEFRKNVTAGRVKVAILAYVFSWNLRTRCASLEGKKAEGEEKKTERMTMNLRGNKHLFVFGTLSEVWEKTLLII